MKFDFYSDPSHGWLKVPRKLIYDLGLEKIISSFSYQRNDSVYLEEDDDATKFVNAMKKIGKTVETRYHYSNKSSKIRGYWHFKNYWN